MRILGDGRWFTFAESADGKERAEFLFRVPSQAFTNQLQIEVHGRTYKTKVGRGGAVRTGDSLKDQEYNRRWLCAALIDSRGVEIPAPKPADAQEAEALAKALSLELGRAVVAGEYVSMDGHWTPEIKRLLVHNLDGSFQVFADRSLREMMSMTESQEAEEGKG